MSRRTMWAVALTVWCTGLGVAQTGTQPGRQTPAGQPAQAARPITDAEFITLAGSGGLLEVQSSQLAAQRATSDEVKRFAQQMVADHTKANQEMATLTSR